MKEIRKNEEEKQILLIDVLKVYIPKLDLFEGGSFSTAIFDSDIHLSVYSLACFIYYVCPFVALKIVLIDVLQAYSPKLDLCEGGSFLTAIFNSDIYLSDYYLTCFISVCPFVAFKILLIDVLKVYIPKLDLFEGGSFSTAIFDSDIHLSVYTLLRVLYLFVRLSLCRRQRMPTICKLVLSCRH